MTNTNDSIECSSNYTIILQLVMDMSEGVTNIQKEIIKTIVTNGEIYHNELSRIIVDEKKLMVSRTYQKNMKRLLDGNYVMSEKRENKVFYTIPHNTFFYSPETESQHTKMIDDLESMFRKLLSKVYPKLSIHNKIDIASKMYHTIQGARSSLEATYLSEYGSNVKFQKQQHIMSRYNKLFSLLYEIISKEKDGEIVKDILVIDVMVKGVNDPELVFPILDEFSKTVINAIEKKDKPLARKLRDDYTKGV